MWFRRDLRASDNAALLYALKSCRQVHCVLVLGNFILRGLAWEDRQIKSIRESLVELDVHFARTGTGRCCRAGRDAF